MLDRKHIPYLIQLLDDDCDDVREHVVQRLGSLGPILQEELEKLQIPLNSHQAEELGVIFQGQHRIWLKKMWPSWFYHDSESKKLEAALGVLAHYLSGWNNRIRLSRLLDEVCNGFKMKHRSRGPRVLAQYLFKEFGLEGNEDDYYDPQNCNLINVITKKKGIPISLAAVFMLVGERLGIPVEGCHFPGHFLARIQYRGRKVFVDCFNAGQIIEEEDILKIKEDSSDGIEDILNEKASANSITKRFLANLIRSYQIEEADDDSELIIGLFKDIEKNINRQAKQLVPVKETRLMSSSKYKTGQLVRHIRYGYKGIIVDLDDHCLATDSWYYGNQTQPKKNQSWYHVLVDGSEQVTYVAQSNLGLAEAQGKISHPLLEYFFNESEDGEYSRNDNPWPNTDI